MEVVKRSVAQDRDRDMVTVKSQTKHKIQACLGVVAAMIGSIDDELQHNKVGLSSASPRSSSSGLIRHTKSGDFDSFKSSAKGVGQGCARCTKLSDKLLAYEQRIAEIEREAEGRDLAGDSFEKDPVQAHRKLTSSIVSGASSASTTEDITVLRKELDRLRRFETTCVVKITEVERRQTEKMRKLVDENNLLWTRLTLMQETLNQDLQQRREQARAILADQRVSLDEAQSLARHLNNSLTAMGNSPRSMSHKKLEPIQQWLDETTQHLETIRETSTGLLDLFDFGLERVPEKKLMSPK